MFDQLSVFHLINDTSCVAVKMHDTITPDELVMAIHEDGCATARLTESSKKRRHRES